MDKPKIIQTHGSAGLKHLAGKKPDGVGMLVEGDKKTCLTAREACNKIIHARAAQFRLDRSDTHSIYQHHLDKDFPELTRANKNSAAHSRHA